MSDRNNSELPSLKYQKSDFVSSVIKAGLGSIPFAGSLLSEVAGNIIPNQRIDRLIQFAEELEKKLTNLDKDFVKSQLNNENFTDLLEEGIRQSARSLTKERRQYISSIIFNGLSEEDIKFSESKHLLKILGEINDVEVILLRFLSVSTLGGDEEFREKHKNVIEPKFASLNASQKEIDKVTLQKSYKEHLTLLGLLSRKYEVDNRTGELKIDKFSRAPKVKSYEITSLGRLLLRHIDLHTDN